MSSLESICQWKGSQKIDEALEQFTKMIFLIVFLKLKHEAKGVGVVGQEKYTTKKKKTKKFIAFFLKSKLEHSCNYMLLT